MLGQKITGWHPIYFPLAWAIKFPIALQALTLAGLIFTRRRRGAEVAIWGSATLYFTAAVLSNFHIGFRHLLPMLPFCIIGGGFALDRLGPKWIVPALLGISSLASFPHGISYFNEWIGGPRNGWKYLADSNLDWGQNYPELAAYTHDHQTIRLRCYLNSFDSPAHYRFHGDLEQQPLPGVVARLEPAPGVYAISVNVLTGLLMEPGREEYLAAFRGRKPDSYSGYSILIFTVP